MTDVDRQVARSREILERVSESRELARRKRRVSEVGARVTRIALADGAILVLAVAIGLVMPIGMFGALGVMTLLMATTLLLALYPASEAPTPARLRQTDLKALPAQTERWLDAQRPALPAPAISLLDQIGGRLDALAPQLAKLDEDAPAAGEVRKLLGEQLPEFIKGYQDVPQGLRHVERNGKSPDAQLIDGLKLIDEQIGDMTERLAQGALDGLATRGRYLEIRYRGDQLEPPEA